MFKKLTLLHIFRELSFVCLYCFISIWRGTSVNITCLYTQISQLNYECVFYLMDGERERERERILFSYLSSFNGKNSTRHFHAYPFCMPQCQFLDCIRVHIVNLKKCPELLSITMVLFCYFINFLMSIKEINLRGTRHTEQSHSATGWKLYK